MYTCGFTFLIWPAAKKELSHARDDAQAGRITSKSASQLQENLFQERKARAKKPAQMCWRDVNAALRRLHLNHLPAYHQC
jgi:hypothetical protein